MIKGLLKIACTLFLGLTLILVLGILVLNLATEPSNDRDWAEDQKLLPYAEIKNNLVTIYNIRNFSYASTTSYTKIISASEERVDEYSRTQRPSEDEIQALTGLYYKKTFDLRNLERVYYIVEPFSGFAGSAHTFLSFEFEDDQFVAISVEIRKEKGESFSAVNGLFNQYELMYVVADERDAVKLRSNHRNDLVYVYPVNTTEESAQKLFVGMLLRANKLRTKPEFYNTLTNTCTTNIMAHVNDIVPGRIPFSYKVLFPAYSDELAFELGLIGNPSTSLSEIRKKYLINDRAQKYADDPNFSVKIRE